jgi:3-methyladenine DNA glycosylase/8-oxoguanine DNA glycosylase
MADASHDREWSLPFCVDVRLMLRVQGRGHGDPTYRTDEAGAIWRTSLTPDGPGTIRVWQVSSKDENATEVRGQAWGPGATWLLDALPGVLGAGDDPSGFDPVSHPVLRDSAKRHPGLRIGKTGLLMEALVPAILEQKVVLIEAHRAWRFLLYKYGTPPPGPAPHGMRVFPAPKVWRRIPSWDWHRSGIEAVRARTIIEAATVASTLERLLTQSHEEADRKLRTLSGIGVWTSAEARQRAAGDPDAVSVGDAHLSNTVGWALEGRMRTTDPEMLELLEPFKGHRYRATRLILLSGKGGAPRRGPRMPVRDYRAF